MQNQEERKHEACDVQWACNNEEGKQTMGFSTVLYSPGETAKLNNHSTNKLVKKPG